MRCVILAGGQGRRLGSLGRERPKALLEVGGRPLLWRVMDQVSLHGVSEFIVLAGHHGRMIRDRVAAPPTGDSLRDRDPGWRIEVVDTGEETATGGRLRRIIGRLDAAEAFLLCYCDGLSDLDLTGMMAFHRAHSRLATIAAVHPPSEFGWLELDGDRCISFREKPARLDAWINAGYFVVDRSALDLIEGDGTVWERGPLCELASMGQLMVFRHHGYWKCIDTLKDLDQAEKDLASGAYPAGRVLA